MQELTRIRQKLLHLQVRLQLVELLHLQKYALKLKTEDIVVVVCMYVHALVHIYVLIRRDCLQLTLALHVVKEP